MNTKSERFWQAKKTKKNTDLFVSQALPLVIRATEVTISHRRMQSQDSASAALQRQVEQACHHGNASPDWGLNMEIIDALNR